MDTALQSNFLDFATIGNVQPASRGPGREALPEHWKQVQQNLQNFCLKEFSDHAHFSAARSQAIETANIFAGTGAYSDMFSQSLKPAPDRQPWLRQRLGYDEVLQADLITLYNNCSTPIHSYNGAAGWIVVLSGECTVTRYREVINYDNDVNMLAKLKPMRTNRYHAGSATLVDSISSPILEMQTRTHLCVLINFHLRDHKDLEHYFYFPTYRNHDQEAFFSRRVNAEL